MSTRRMVLTLGVVLVIAGVSIAQIPTIWDGRNRTATSVLNGFYRFTWFDGQGYVKDYRIERVSWRFTAATSGAAEAVRVVFNTGHYQTLVPNMTVSIQSDDGAGNPSGTVLGTADTFDLPLGQVVVKDVPIGTANFTAGTVYHVHIQGNNIVKGPWLNAPVDFMLYDGHNKHVNDHLRTYDQSEDLLLQGIRYDHDTLTWEIDEPDGDTTAVHEPLFELYANYDSQTQTVSNPIQRLAHGERPNPPGAWNGLSIGVGQKRGESFVAHYPNAVPVAKKARILMKRSLGDPDGDLVIELQDSSHNVLGSGTIAKDDVVSYTTNQYGDWAEVDLNADVQLDNGQRYYLVAHSPTSTTGAYVLCVAGSSMTMPTSGNTYYGEEAYVANSTDGGVTWDDDVQPTDVGRDISFALAIVIPGDANGDLIVNVGDLGILGANYGLAGKTWAEADFNGDTLVNVGDLGILGAHYGEHLMPEPATVSLLVLGGLAVISRRRSRTE